MVLKRVAVCATESTLQPQARALARRLDLPLACMPGEYEILLRLTPRRLELVQTGRDAPGPVYVDFVSGTMGHRRRFGGGRGQLLAKAVGIKKDRLPSVTDATAGLGRDAFVLAQLGCQVRMLERSAVVAALLEDGLRRAAQAAELADIVARLSLEVADARALLSGLDAAQRPEVVYVDPMHPQRTNSAAVKKEMRLFRVLVGPDQDDAALLQAALQAARRRVVVKRPRKAPAIEGRAPDLVFTGKSTRFDVYLVHA